MEDKDRPYTEQEFEELFKQSGIDAIAKDYCWEELCEWIDSLRHKTQREFNTLSEAAWHNLLRFSHPNIYAEQRKNGQSHEWSKEFAQNFELYGENEMDKIIQATYHSLEENLEEKIAKKELDKFIDHYSDDPILNRICKQYFYEVDGDEWLKLSKAYTSEFYKCKENGKSDIYADAYADAYTSDYTEKYCCVLAEIKESAIKNGLNEDDSDFFARFCARNYGNETLFTGIRDFNKYFKEPWEKEIYYNLILKEEQENGGTITDSFRKAMREELGLPCLDDSVSPKD